jgi:hypothetical protein
MTEIAIERLTGIALFVVALSHLLQPRGWADYFAQLRSRGVPGAFVNGMMSLALGCIVVGFHGTQWHGWPAIATFVGWAQVLKGVTNLCFPDLALRSMASVPIERAWKFRAGGALMLPLAAAIIIASIR